MSCVVPAVPVETLKGRIASRAYAERIPLWTHVEIIATCNFKCKHCFIAPCAEREDVMSAEQAEVLFDKIERAGVLSLLLTGGEILTHKQFRQIYLSARRRGFLVFLNTNAYLIGTRWADFLAEHRPQHVSISLYGLSDERYEAVTGIPNAFGRVVQAIDLLRERGIHMDLKCPANTMTADELPAMKRFAEARGIKFRYDAIMTPETTGSMKPVHLQLAPEAVLDLDERMQPGLENWREFHGQFPPQAARGGVNPVYGCGAGRISFCVNVHGGVSTCLSSRQTVGNIFEQSFDEIWASLGGKVAKRFPDGHPCATCKFRNMCAGCPATVEQVTGLPEGYVQQYCKITHLRAHALGLHPTGIPRTVETGIPAGIALPTASAARALPVLS